MKKYSLAASLTLVALFLAAISASCTGTDQDNALHAYMLVDGTCTPLGGSECPAAADEALHAYLLADELRQTSDDLTRMARLYAVTGEDRYQEYFQRILDVRNGLVARPANPNIAYWDIAVATGEMPPTDGQMGALRDLLRDAGLSSQQLELVATAEERSNSLAQLESAAFAASLEEARNTLHGEEYNRLKAEIMQPINELLESLLDG